ncbi:MAG: extracellular solute-binding protein [Candidatus Eremiobacteraeota bacterium]|nr:extracellular solute-binding protein [Candidatus Eremiobacteraeota bacterium]
MGKRTWANFVAFLLAGCSQAGDPSRLWVWAHEGREVERRILSRQVARFQQQHPGMGLKLTFLPEGSYNSQVQAAALAGQLPDILEFDGPLLYRYVWQGCLRPLGRLLNDSARTNLLPSLERQGTFRGRLYSVGVFDSGLALYGRKSLLESVGARLPSRPEEAWTIAQFERILKDLARADEDGQVLDLKLNYQGEWLTYAFSPVLVSAGADLRHLDRPEAARALTLLQEWSEHGLIDPNLDDAAFVEGRVALSWVGHWEYPRYAERWGGDLCLIPLPNFGIGSRSGQGSWNWAITSRCGSPRRAAEFLNFLLEDAQVLEMTAGNGAVPGTLSAIAKSPLYQKGGPLRLFSQQLLEGWCAPRPATPAYPFVTSVFQQAVRDIVHGAPVKKVLQSAAQDIRQDELDNEDYR